MPGVKPGTAIVLKKDVPKSQDTDKRAKTAETILQMWPDEKQNIADEAGVSRTHVDNTLESHFIPLLKDREQYATHYNDVDALLEELHREWTNTDETNQVSPNINPPDHESPEFVSGYMRGYLDCWDEHQGIASTSNES